MSADQRKKRLNTDVFSYTSREQYGSKKKHLSSSQFGSNWKVNPHASLKWDGNEKRSLTKGEQIGLSKRDLKPFRTPLTHCSNSLADVITIPKDVFELDDLAEVLSIEVWQSILTEKERSHLTHFLPRDVDPDEVVNELLAGENLHFGNPFLKWSSTLCSGELHPEAVLSNDQTLGANKNAYYSELQKYHDNMIRNLQKLKDRCANAKDPEAEIEQMMWRTRKQPGKEVRCQQRSVTADEKACSSDNQSTLKAKGSDLPRRKDTRKDKDGRQVGSSDVVALKPKKREKLQKFSSNYGDGSKYMSYVKISKSQHELVRNMKQSGNSIQSKALNHVIGNLNSFNVKPYVMFEEEEQKRIEDYWSKLARKDLPSAVSKWRKIQSERREIMKSLCLELEEKCLMEEDEIGHSDDAHNYEEASVSSDDNEQTEEEEAPLAHESVSDDGQDSDASSPEGQPPSELPCLDESQFAEEQASLQVCSLGVNQKCSPMDLNEDDNDISPKSNDTCSVKSDGHVTSEASLQFRSTSVSPENKRSGVNEEVPHSSTRDAWPGITMVEPSFCPVPMDYASCSGMPVNHSEAIKGQPTQLIDLASSIRDENPSKSLLPQQTDQLPFFGTYQNDQRHDLHTLVKRDNYHEEPKKTALGFHPTSNLLIDPIQFPGHSREQLIPSFPLQPRHVHTREQLNPSFPLEPRHRAPSDFYLHPTIPENLYPDSSSRYSVPRPEQFTPVNLREWNSAPRFSTPMQAPLNNNMDLLNHNWFQVENRAQGGWSGSEVFPNPNLGSGSGGGDQSLFSVLSQCNSLHPGAPTFGGVGPTDKFIPTGNFPGDMGIGVPRNSPLPQHSVAASPLDYLNGHDIGPTTLKAGDMGWMNLPHQSSALHDAAGKPFPKSWNQ